MTGGTCLETVMCLGTDYGFRPGKLDKPGVNENAMPGSQLTGLVIVAVVLFFFCFVLFLLFFVVFVWFYFTCTSKVANTLQEFWETVNRIINT